MTATAPATDTASHLELFFDLVYVFAITQIVAVILDDHSAAGFARAALLLALMWWTWSQYTWAANAVGTSRPSIRFAVLAAMGATLAMAVALPDAFTSAGAFFAATYFAVNLFGILVYWLGLRHDAAHRSALLTYIPLAVTAPVLVLAGGFAGPGPRPWIWLLALGVDAVAALNAGRGSFRVAPGHFAERHRLFVIIALGEAIVAVGLTAAGLDRDGMLVAALVASFLAAAALWWAYFDWLGDAAEHALAAAPAGSGGPVARDLYTFLHLPIVAGIVIAVVAAEETVAHPGDPLPGFAAFALVSGLGLFLLGCAAVAFRASRGFLVERVVAAVLIAVLAVVSGGIDAVFVTATAAAIVAVALLAERARLPRVEHRHGG